MALIEREAAKTKKVYCEERHEYVVPVAALDWLPTIDAAPVGHGKWIVKELSFGVFGVGQGCKCSACDKWAGADAFLMPYCPNCGARMDGGEGHGTD